MKAPVVILAGAESDIQRIYSRLTDFRDGAGDEFMERLGGVFRQLEIFSRILTVAHARFSPRSGARPRLRRFLSNRISGRRGSRGRGSAPGSIVAGADSERAAGVELG